MFELKESIKIININHNYIKALHDECSQVFYLPSEYDNKPYVGILINDNGRQYAIPLSSAKERHKDYRCHENGRFLVYDNVEATSLVPDGVYKQNEDGTYKHILSVLVVPKMIPVKDDVFTIFDVNPNPIDDIDLAKYKKLVNKELGFCINIKDRIIKDANKIYSTQIRTGKIYPNYVDFKKLEAVCDTYNN